MTNNLEKLNSFVDELEVKMSLNRQSALLLEGQDDLLGGMARSSKNRIDCKETKNSSDCKNAGNCDYSINVSACVNTGYCYKTNNGCAMTGGGTGGTGGATGGASGHIGSGFPSVMF